MKKFRKTYEGETYSQRERQSKEYNYKYWKKISPYSRRCRTCARALRLLLSLSSNRLAYYNAWTKISQWWPVKKRKWQ